MLVLCVCVGGGGGEGGGIRDIREKEKEEMIITFFTINFQIFYPDLIDKRKTPQYNLVSYVIINSYY